MIGEGFPQAPPIGTNPGGVADGGVLDALRGNPQLMQMLLMGLSGMTRQTPQAGMPSPGSLNDPLSAILNLYAMKQMMGKTPTSPTGMEGSPKMPASSAGSDSMNPLSWLSLLSSVLGGIGGGGG